MATATDITTAAEVHPLTGSSPPGAGAPAFKPAVAPEDQTEDLQPLEPVVGPNLHRLSPSDRILVMQAKAVSGLARLTRSDATGSDTLDAIKRLIDIRPQSSIALGMKADATIDCVAHLKGQGEITALGLSVWHDAVHVALQSVMPGGMGGGPDTESWEFRDLVSRWATAKMDSQAYFGFGEQIEKYVVEGGIPPELFVTDADQAFFSNAEGMPHFLERKWFGHPKTIDALRLKTAGGEFSPGGKEMTGRQARVQQILTAYDDWERSGDFARQSRAAISAYETSSERADLYDELESRIMKARVSTLDGLITKAFVLSTFHTDPWASLAYYEQKLARDEAAVGGVRPLEYIECDLLRMVIDRKLSLHQLAGEIEPAKKPDRRALEAYAEWLDQERRLLTLELYPGAGQDAPRCVPSSTAARNFHYPVDTDFRSVSPPSSRAEEMMDRLGIDWRAEDPAGKTGGFRHAYQPSDAPPVMGAVA